MTMRTGPGLTTVCGLWTAQRGKLLTGSRDDLAYRLLGADPSIYLPYLGVDLPRGVENADRMHRKMEFPGAPYSRSPAHSGGRHVQPSTSTITAEATRPRHRPVQAIKVVFNRWMHSMANVWLCSLRARLTFQFLSGSHASQTFGAV
jgi:hypothetical protein